MGRWEDARPDSTWAERTRILASYIPVGASVLEFGAWTMELKRHLPPLCTYTPSDLFYRGKGTIVCDLNGPELPVFPKHDVAVFGGVLEYAQALAHHLRHPRHLLLAPALVLIPILAHECDPRWRVRNYRIDRLGLKRRHDF